MLKPKVDTPRKNAWCYQVNKPGFVVKPVPPQRVVIKIISAEEYRKNYL